MNSSRLVMMLLLPVLCSVNAGPTTLAAEGARRKRNVVTGFGRMLWQYTGKFPYAYFNYGNWCGVGGSGVAVDSLDRCCQLHDECYDRALDKDCHDYGSMPYMVPYDYHLTNNEITCGDGRKVVAGRQLPPPAELERCGLAICQCDAEATKCFARAPYHPQYKLSVTGMLVGAVKKSAQVIEETLSGR